MSIRERQLTDNMVSRNSLYLMFLTRSGKFLKCTTTLFLKYLVLNLDIQGLDAPLREGYSGAASAKVYKNKYFQPKSYYRFRIFFY